MTNPINPAVLTAERTKLQTEISSLDQTIASVQGEIKVHLQQLGITEADIQAHAQTAQASLVQAEESFNKCYAEYESYKASLVQPEASTPLQTPTSPFNL